MTTWQRMARWRAWAPFTCLRPSATPTLTPSTCGTRTTSSSPWAPRRRALWPARWWPSSRTSRPSFPHPSASAAHPTIIPCPRRATHEQTTGQFPPLGTSTFLPLSLDLTFCSFFHFSYWLFKIAGNVTQWPGKSQEDETVILNWWLSEKKNRTYSPYFSEKKKKGKGNLCARCLFCFICLLFFKCKPAVANDVDVVLKKLSCCTVKSK